MTLGAIWPNPLILQVSLYLLCLCSEISSDLCVTLALHHCALEMKGNSRPFCAKSPLMKHNPELEWTSSFLYPKRILHLLFSSVSNKNKREQERGQGRGSSGSVTGEVPGGQQRYPDVFS